MVGDGQVRPEVKRSVHLMSLVVILVLDGSLQLGENPLDATSSG